MAHPCIFGPPVEAGVQLFSQADVEAVNGQLLTGRRPHGQLVSWIIIHSEVLVGNGCALLPTLPSTQH